MTFVCEGANYSQVSRVFERFRTFHRTSNFERQIVSAILSTAFTCVNNQQKSDGVKYVYMVGPAFSINYSEPHPLGKHPDVYRLQLFSSFVVNR